MKMDVQLKGSRASGSRKNVAEFIIPIRPRPELGSIENGDTYFSWDDYLEECKATAAPSDAFTHVEHSFKNYFKIGMQLEIPNSERKDTYWRASIKMICGDLLSLSFVGCDEDKLGDRFWFDIKRKEYHFAGWCQANYKILLPPKVVLERHPNYLKLIEPVESESLPAGLENPLVACMPIHQIKCGMKVEIRNKEDPASVWIATILKNVGCRLLLRYDGIKDDIHDFWMFYLCDRLHNIGYAAENGIKYSVPTFLKSKHPDEEWNKILQNSLNSSEEPFPAHILESKIPLEEHGFQEGMKLEAVDPKTCCDICPATVSRVIDNYYFLVSIDSYSMHESNDKILCCNSNEQLIFPINWAEENGLELKIPKGYEQKNSKFDWREYLRFCNAIAAPVELFQKCIYSEDTEFKDHMKLEAVDPLNPSKIYVATIEKIVKPVMFLTFDVEQTPKRIIITGTNSMDIYPTNWCDTNDYPLQTPAYHSKNKNAIIPCTAEPTEKSVKAECKVSSQEQHGKSWCPKIYFNHRCFTGPLLSKSRLAELPKAIGPGPVNLVMNEVISRVVNIAYKSSRVLQLLQVQGKPSPVMQQQVVKAKYKGKSYRATIDVVQNSAQVEDFCKEICTKLECCPYLFGPQLVEEVCPSNCHTQTKTKFGYNFVKKHKKPGRPALASTYNPSSFTTDSAEAIRRGPGRKKKRKHWTQLLAESENKFETDLKENSKPDESSANEEEVDVKPDNESPAHTSEQATKSENSTGESKENVKKKLKLVRTSNIVTRGAKLPNFALWHPFTSFHSKRGRPRTRPIRPVFPPRKVGRPLGSTKKFLTLHKESEDDEGSSSIINEEETKLSPNIPILESNPKDWSIDEVEKFILTTDCAPVAKLLKEEEIDGQALLLLEMCSVQEFLNLKPEPAMKFCTLLEGVKLQFFK